ncbi:MAG: PaaI family thioesterase [Candidatus Geothermincolales bacterium]
MNGFSSMQERFRSIIEDRARHSPYYQLLGMRVLELAPGESRIGLELEDHHRDERGLVHPGVIFSLADACSGVALATLLPRGSRRVITIELKCDFLELEAEGTLFGWGRVVEGRTGERTAVSSSEIRDDRGRLLACGLATFMILPPRT